MENTAIDTIKINSANINNDGTITLTASSGSTIDANSSASTISIDAGSLLNNITYSGSLTNLGNGIVCNSSTGSYYTTTGFSSTYTYPYSNDCYEAESVEDTIKKEVKKDFKEILENEDEMMPLIKNYLRKYLEEVMDNPEELIKRDEEIERQKEEIKELKNQIESLKEELTDLRSKSIYIGLNEDCFGKLDGYKTFPDNGIVYTNTSEPNWYYESNSSTTANYSTLEEITKQYTNKQDIKNPPSAIA